jgi:hypothetical protein
MSKFDFTQELKDIESPFNADTARQLFLEAGFFTINPF